MVSTPVGVAVDALQVIFGLLCNASMLTKHTFPTLLLLYSCCWTLLMSPGDHPAAVQHLADMVEGAGYSPLARVDRTALLHLADTACAAGRCPCLQVIIGLLRNAMVSSGAKDFLVDGFPRELSQAFTFEQMIKPCK
jgi:hypothetical protein